MYKPVRFGILVCALLPGLACGGGHKDETAHEQRAVSAKVAIAALSGPPHTRDAVGTVRSATTSAIQSKTVAHVTAVHVKPGDTVAAGALLAELDARDTDAQLKSAESGVNAAKRALDEMAESIAAAQSATRAAQAQRDLARTTFERQAKLFAEKAISKQAFDEAETAAKAAAAEAEMREEQMSALEAKREQSKAALQQAQAALETAKVLSSYTRVTAPFAGIVTSKSVDIGDLASPGMTLFTLEDNRAYRFEAEVDESSLANIRVGDSLEVTIDGASDDAFRGVVGEIVPTADPASRTSTVKIDLPSNDMLRSGQFGRVHIPIEKPPQIMVPRTALVVRGQLEGVYALDEGGVAHLRLIKTGRTAGEWVEVLAGLNEGDRYVETVTPDIADGVRIETR